MAEKLSLVGRRGIFGGYDQSAFEMKFVALISGGKDSVFNIMKMQAEGYELTALANLYPVEDKEIDSYMYQTVGHEMIDRIAECLEKPLYRA